MWVSDSWGKTWLRGANGELIIEEDTGIDTEGYATAEGYSVNNPDDARLIAAAPELLEACEYILWLTDHISFDTSTGTTDSGYDEGNVKGGEMVQKAIDKLKAAIRKAKGES